jgi:hypothetical protein
MAAGVLVSLAEGTGDADQMFALIKKLRDTSITHPRRSTRELGGGVHLQRRMATRRRATPSTALPRWQRSVRPIVAQKAAPEMPGFRAFLTEIAAAVADANIEGGFFRAPGAAGPAKPQPWKPSTGQPGSKANPVIQRHFPPISNHLRQNWTFCGRHTAEPPRLPFAPNRR